MPMFFTITFYGACLPNTAFSIHCSKFNCHSITTVVATDWNTILCPTRQKIILFPAKLETCTQWPALTHLAAFLFCLLFGGSTASWWRGRDHTVDAVNEANYFLDFLVIEQRRCRRGSGNWCRVTGGSWRLGRWVMVRSTARLWLVLSLLLQHSSKRADLSIQRVFQCRSVQPVYCTSSARWSPCRPPQ